MGAEQLMPGTTAGPARLMANLRSEVSDARLLLEFAVATGKPVGTELIAAVKRGERWLATGEGGELPGDEERTAFEEAYRNLAQVLTPVTAATLKATEESEGGTSVARDWSRRLWWYTALAAGFVLFSENLTRIIQEFYPADREGLAAGATMTYLSMIIQSIEPFAYGALGALAYLLRSAHVYIYERTFDVRRLPEYNNRILLGMVAGGAIKLFVTEVTTDAGTVTELSGAALAFIAGYNGDFLFSTIERVIAAVLPKVGLESVRRQGPDRMAMMTVERLVSRYAAAPAEERKMIERLVERLTSGATAGSSSANVS